MKRPETLREILDVIDAVLIQDDVISKQLWDVLTALRGPDDSEQYQLKETGTVHIRQAAFPRTYASVMEMGGYAHGAQYYSRYPLVAPNPRVGGHFNGHLSRAIDALELKPTA